MIDRKGKIAGKISIVDILLIILLILVVSAFVYKNTASDPLISYSDGDSATITIKMSNMPKYYLDAIHQGEKIFSDEDQYIGIIQSVSSEPSYVLTSGYLGANITKKVPITNRVDIFMEISTQCYSNDIAYIVNGEASISVGSSLTLQNANVYLTDASVERITFIA